MKRRRKCGVCSANRFITRVERSHRVRIQRDMFYLVYENKKLGGTYWKKVLRKYNIKWGDLFSTDPAKDK